MLSGRRWRRVRRRPRELRPRRDRAGQGFCETLELEGARRSATSNPAVSLCREAGERGLGTGQVSNCWASSWTGLYVLAFCCLPEKCCKNAPNAPPPPPPPPPAACLPLIGRRVPLTALPAWPCALFHWPTFLFGLNTALFAFCCLTCLLCLPALHFCLPELPAACLPGLCGGQKAPNALPA